jgi:hypothetical protein
MEALKYFEKDDANFSANHIDKESAIKFVKELYEGGAIKIEVVDIYDDNADTFMIHLPESKSTRLDLVSIVFEQRPDEMDGDWNGDEPIRLWWD